ncbi:MAG: HesA/MoeB/ThiF family protein [Spirochaetaceae bacterium]
MTDVSGASGVPGAREQFSRHLALTGTEGLERLSAATVSVVGAGGLGSTVLEMLARSGVGTIRIHDDGVLDLPDLNRQILYTHDDLGRPKADAAAARLSRINPALRVEAHGARVVAGTDFSGADVVVDCLDNFETRFAVDEATYEAGIPLVHGGVYQYFGQVTTIHRDYTRSLSALFGRGAVEQDAEANKPMFPPAVAGTATVEATECIKLLLGRPVEQLLYNRFLSLDYLSYDFDEIQLSP